MNSFGRNFCITIWGESHGASIGVCIDGAPAGIALTEEEFACDLARRRSGAAGTTSRIETDTPHIISGVYNGQTTGAPLTIEFCNGDCRSSDYTEAGSVFRPSHADMTAYRKFEGYNDPRGGGHLSGRLTVAMVAAGVVAKKILSQTTFSTEIIQIGGCSDKSLFDEIIAQATAGKDSVGGVVECRVNGLMVGCGEPLFDSIESMISHLLFSIPAVKGVEFGAGFAVAARYGSQNNDAILDASGGTATNNDGGINGGIANGNELVVRVAIKPTPSISRPQTTFDPTNGKVQELIIGGRHDTCIALRAAVVVEAAVAIALADLILRK